MKKNETINKQTTSGVSSKFYKFFQSIYSLNCNKWSCIKPHGDVQISLDTLFVSLKKQLLRKKTF